MAYSERHYKWIKENFKNYKSYTQFTHDFNKAFGLSKSTSAVQQLLTKKLKTYLMTDRKVTFYTPKEEEWLIYNYKNFETYEKLTNAMNELFKKNRSVSSVREKCTKRLKLKGIKNPTAYKKGNKKEQLPIGTIRKGGNGSTYIKVLDSAYSYQSGYTEPYWMPIQKKIYQDHYGEVPRGKMVIFLDGNNNNLNINNLYCIDRKISATLATNGWYTGNIKLTLTAIKWCELYYATKEVVK